MLATEFGLDIINNRTNERAEQRMLKGDKDGKKTVALIAAGFSGGQPRRGVDEGPAAMLNEGGLITQMEALNWNVELDNHLIDTHQFKPQGDDTYGILKNVEYVSNITKEVHDCVKKACEEKKLALTIGGDHSLAIGTVSGSLEAYPKMGLIWVDAHGDINTEECTTSGNLHGCPIAFVSGLTKNVPHFSKWLKSDFDLSRLVYIGLRDVDAPEKQIFRDHNIKAFSMTEVDEWGIGRIMDAAIKYLHETAPDTPESPADRDAAGNKICPIHISYDVDGMDPAFAPSTGTPVKGGLSYREGHYIMEALHHSGSLVAVDIMEVNPALGSAEDRAKTVAVGCSLVRSMLGEGLLY
ncbi:Arginase, catabolizes arginine to ornithine and urea [Podochytrium sp. JEL0797]|nr:Arginase, catabolizes arginine to ornithine and urea [Podochytrium sp. JEL0797]